MSFIIGCATPKFYENKFPCGAFSNDEIKSQLMTILTQESFDLKASNKEGTYFFFENNPEESTAMLILAGQRSTTHISWTFYLNQPANPLSPSAIVAIPKFIVLGAGANTQGLADQTAEKWTGYWNVRARLEQFCGSKVIITEIKKEEKSLKEQSLNSNP